MEAVLEIARRETIEHVRGLRLIVLTLLALIMTPLALHVGVADYRSRLANSNRLEVDRERLAAGPAGEVQGMDLPFTPQNDLAVLRAVRPPEQLSVLVRGIDGALPEYWDFTPAGVQAGAPMSRIVRFSDTLGQLDLDFVVRVVLGLLAVLLAFDAIAGEKELGTLRIVMSYPVSRAALLGGKMLGGLLGLAVPLAATFGAVALSAMLFGLDLWSGSRVVIACLLFVCATLYLVCLYALGLVVSTLATSHRTSLVAALVTWVIVVLALPPFASLAARVVAPVPLPQALEATKAAIEDDLLQETEQRRGKVYRAETGAEEGTINGEMFLRHRQDIEARLGALQTDYASKRRRLLQDVDSDAERRAAWQDSVAGAFMVLSPAALFSQAGSALCGTGDDEAPAWLDAVRRQQLELDRRVFDDPPAIYVRNGSANLFLARHKPIPVSGLPPFVAPAKTLASGVEVASRFACGLLAYALILSLVAYMAFSRYDVR